MRISNIQKREKGGMRGMEEIFVIVIGVALFIAGFCIGSINGYDAGLKVSLDILRDVKSYLEKQ